ncbi:hypothetical protein PsorP6_017339 [Peronosclerospora sorghi]|uniref:Uncharacterized protein n=1 Tax=Peronosclerospora sorghi TaxID=230839 RepID=A0ACC0WMZ3_9STRA|nr:hypothetical protein PsorP6_017339 [Peronosclerospora sorghi]
MSAGWDGRDGELEAVVEAYRLLFDEVMDVVARTSHPWWESDVEFVGCHGYQLDELCESDERDEWSSVAGVDMGQRTEERVKCDGSRH